MFEILFGVVLALFVVGGIWAFFVTRKVKNDGIETFAVVSRIEEHVWSGDVSDAAYPNTVTEVYYITYTNQDGQTVEALLSNPGDLKLEVGSRMKIKYLPDRQDYPVMVGEL